MSQYLKQHFTNTTALYNQGVEYFKREFFWHKSDTVYKDDRQQTVCTYSSPDV